MLVNTTNTNYTTGGLTSSTLRLYKFFPEFIVLNETSVGSVIHLKDTDWTIGILGFDSRRGLGIFFFTTMSRTALGPTQPPIQWIRGALSLRIKRPGHEADHPPPSSAEIKEKVELYLHSHTPSWRGA
jgi:hypothetical protein